VGITVKHFPLQLLLATQQDGGIVYNGKFDVVNFAWNLDPLGDFSSIYSCASIPPNGQNDLHWCNQRATAAMNAFYAHYDQADRNKDDAIVQEELFNEVPTIVLTGRENIYVANRDLRNFVPNSSTPFDNFMEVDI
jgi:ABC-type transport system substrate-binding protein